MLSLLDVAAHEAHLERPAWKRQESGDGELALLPPEQSESVLIDDFVRELDAALYRHNRVRLPQRRLRLRLAIHFGVAIVASNGYAGAAAVVTSRLLNARPLKQVLEDESAADLVVGLSDAVYQDSVAGGLTKTSPDAFRCHAVDDEKYKGLIWIRAFGRPVPSGASRLAEPRPEAPQEQGAASQSAGGQSAPRGQVPPSVHVQNTFNRDVDVDGVIGVNLDFRGA